MQRERERDDTTARREHARPARPEGSPKTDRPDTQNETKVDSNTAADKP